MYQMYHRQNAAWTCLLLNFVCLFPPRRQYHPISVSMLGILGVPLYNYYIKKLLRNWGALDRLIAHTYWNTWALSFKKLRDPGNWQPTFLYNARAVLSWLPFDSFCARLMGWVGLALLSWPDLIKSATSHQKMLQHGQLKVYLHNEWQKAGLFEAIFACKWMWKINQDVSVGRYPIEEAKISPMAWEQILRWFVRRQYGLSDL